MRVGLPDPQGLRSWNAALYAVSLSLLFAAFFVFPYAEVLGPLLGLASFALFNLVGLFGARPAKARTAELSLGAGFIDLQTSALRRWRIRTTDITGATTARTANGLRLTLQHRKRLQPITLEVETEADASKIRHALGIGHGGFGTIAWSTSTSPMMRAAFFGRLLAAAVALLAMAALVGNGLELFISVAMGLGQFAFIGAFLGVVGLLSRSAPPTVVMAADGLRLKTPRGWFSLPYGAILDVNDTPQGLVFSVPPPYGVVHVDCVGPRWGGPTDAGRKILVAQITAAAQRARGLGPQKDDVTWRVDTLRRAGESPRDWLVRLDMAGQLLSAGAGYRGNTLDAEDLWAILEDPEAEADLRAAAARVLRHSREPSTRVRIQTAVAAVRDEKIQRRLRIATSDDLDGASQELAYLDATEPRLPYAMPGRPMAERR